MLSVVIEDNKLCEKLKSISNINFTNALNKAAIIVENDAKRRCPVDTGNLRNSITHEVEGNSATVGTNAEYAPYVEIGTGLFSSMGNGRKDRWCYQTPDGEWHSTIGQQPQPFLEPALTSNRNNISKVIQEEMKKELKEIAGR